MMRFLILSVVPLLPLAQLCNMSYSNKYQAFDYVLWYVCKVVYNEGKIIPLLRKRTGYRS